MKKIKFFKTMMLAFIFVIFFTFNIYAEEIPEMLMPTLISIDGFTINKPIEFYLNGETKKGTIKGELGPSNKVIDSQGNIYIIDADKNVVFNALEGSDENGLLKNPMVNLKNNQILDLINNNQDIIFDNYEDFKNFVYFYINNYGNIQGINMEGKKTSTNKILVENEDFKNIEFDELKYNDLLNSLIVDIDTTKSRKEILNNIVTKVYDFYDYDMNYMVDTLEKSIQDKKGVCYHYVRLTSLLLKKLNIEHEIIFGKFGEINHVWLRLLDENNNWIYSDPTTAETFNNYYNIDYSTYLNQYNMILEF